MEDLKTEEHFLLYIDFLGSKALIAEDENKWLNAIHSLYTEATKYTHNIATDNIIKLVPLETVSIHIFSDNIAISVKANTYNVHNHNILSFLFYVASYIQAHALMKYNWLVRGAITSGKLYSSIPSSKESTRIGLIWGSALTRAYNIESETAIYPRIVLDKKTQEKYSWDNYFTLEDSDGILYIDYLYLQSRSNPEFMAKYVNFQHMKDTLDNLLKKNGEDEKIIQKIIWTQSYMEHFDKMIHPELSDSGILKTETIFSDYRER